jgi:hypothetical protein
MKRIFLTLATLGALASLVTAPSWGAERPSAAEYAPGQIIVKFRPGLRPYQVPAAVASTQDGAKAQRIIGSAGGAVALASLPSGTTVEQAMATFEASSDVVYAEPNYLVSTTQATRSTAVHPSGIVRLLDSYDDNDGGRPVFRERTYTPGYTVSPSYPTDDPSLNLWGWYYVGANIVWKPGPAIPVAVVDTGIDRYHPDLLRRVIYSKDLVENDNRPDDDNGQGTMLSGIIGAITNNRKGISGVGRAKLVAIKAVSFAGHTTHFDLAEGIRFASKYPVILVGVATPDESQTLRDAVYLATYQRRRLLIAAAGDAPAGEMGTTTPMYPAAYATGTWSVEIDGVPTDVDFVNRVLAVGAQGAWVDSSSDPDSDPDTFVEYCKAPYSQYGDWVSIVAPGTDITTTTPFRKDYYNLRNGDTTEGYNVYSGTALAAAFVAGTAARVYAENPGFHNVAVAERLLGVGADSNHGFRVYTGDVDVDGDGTPDIANCWEPEYAESHDENIDSDRTYHLADLNAAMALGRSSIWWRVYEAYTGLPLSRAQGLALNKIPALKRTSRGTGSNGDPLDGVVEIVDVDWYSENYHCRVRRPWYTNGPKDVFGLWVNSRHLYFQGRLTRQW